MLKLFLYLTQSICSKIEFIDLQTKMSRKEYIKNVCELVCRGVAQTRVRKAIAVKPLLTSQPDTSSQYDLGLKLFNTKVLFKCR